MTLREWYENGLNTVMASRRLMLFDFAMPPLAWAEGFQLINRIEMYLLRQMLASHG